jgi:hypothetical protein
LATKSYYIFLRHLILSPPFASAADRIGGVMRTTARASPAWPLWHRLAKHGRQADRKEERRVHGCIGLAGSRNFVHRG